MTLGEYFLDLITKGYSIHFDRVLYFDYDAIRIKVIWKDHYVKKVIPYNLMNQCKLDNDSIILETLSRMVSELSNNIKETENE